MSGNISHARLGSLPSRLTCHRCKLYPPVSSRLTLVFNQSGDEEIMLWEKPMYTDLRFGFEVTLYIYNR